MAFLDRQKPRARRVDLPGPDLREKLIEWTSPRHLRRLFVLGFFFTGLMLLVHLPFEPLGHALGERTREPLRARAAFTLEDKQATQQAHEEAKLKAPNVYRRNFTYTARILDDFAKLIAVVKGPETPPPPQPAAAPSSALPASSAAAPASSLPARSPEQLAEDQRKIAEAEKAAVEARNKLLQSWSLGREIEALQPVVAVTESLDDLFRRAKLAADNVNQMLIASDDRYIREHGETTRSQIYIYNDADKIFTSVPKDSILQAGLTETASAIKLRVREAFAGSTLPAWLPDRLADRICANLPRNPNLVFDENLTADKKAEAARNTPAVERSFERGAEIVPPDTLIQAAEYEKLQAEHAAYLAHLRFVNYLSSILGSAILIAMLIGLVVIYTRLYQQDIAERAIRGFVLALLFLIVLALAKFSYTGGLRLPIDIFALTTSAMIVAIAYNRRFALASAWMMIFIIALATRLDFAHTLLLFLGATVAIFQLDEIRNRSKLIRVGLFAGLTFFLVVWAEALWAREVHWSSMGHVLHEASLAFVFGAAPGFLILGLLPSIERLFNVVTSISLLELCDVNQPALRDLAVRAPGTYSHSLLLGSLVEPAAEAVGADGLLARVGAYFHDIGKVSKPQYFTENQGQTAEDADHADLTPSMSKLIIAGHVKDGLDLADQYDLPKVVRPFIAEHHGTTVIEYFYHEALQDAGGEEISDAEFRYPGPKPASRETAILMLADGCEGATRALKDFSPNKIEDKVHEIVLKRLLDGQLDESGLTLNDVTTVEHSLTKSLISVYHGRIAYPEPDEDKSNGNGRHDRSEI